MMTREEICAVYTQGPEAVSTLVEPLCALIAQQQEQIAQLQGRVKALADRLLARAVRDRDAAPHISACPLARGTEAIGRSPVHHAARLSMVTDVLPSGLSLLPEVVSYPS